MKQQNQQMNDVDELDEFNAIVGTAIPPTKEFDSIDSMVNKLPAPKYLKAEWSFEAAEDLNGSLPPGYVSRWSSV